MLNFLKRGCCDIGLLQVRKLAALSELIPALSIRRAMLIGNKPDLVLIHSLVHSIQVNR